MKKRKYRLHFAEIVLMIAAAVFLLTGAVSLRTQEQVAEKVVRLHVLANSDSEADQALKLKVRDAVSARTEQLLRSAEDRQDAAAVLQDALPELEAIACETVRAEGFGYGVKAELEPTAFPTKVYDGFALPAGEYLALRILIGQAAGQNWWCVVFPPLCTATAAQVPAAAMSAGLSEEEIALITEENDGYVLKFKAVELWETLKQKLGK